MSIWITEFEKVVKRLDEIKEMIDEVNCGSNPQCMRMKKVFNMNYKIINNLDPELISLRDIYHLLYSQKQLGGQLESFQNYLNSLMTFIKNKNYERANLVLDSILNIIKPYILYKKRFGDPLIESIKLYNEELYKYLNELKKVEDEVKKLQKIVNKIYEYETELFEDDEEESIKTKIESILNEVERKKEKIDELYAELFIDSNEIISIETKIENFVSEIEEFRDSSVELKKEIEEILINTENTIKDLKKFYIEVFGEINEETGEREGGLKQEIEKRQKDLENLILKYKDFEKSQKQKYDALYEKIEGLLPGAVSAGLAKAYEEKRKKFEKQTKFWSWVFIIAMIGLFVAGFKIISHDIESPKDTFLHILKYSPLYLPAIWLAAYAAKRRNENMRLEQKYAHKETLAKSYISYKKQIEELENDEKDELLKNLLKSTTDTIAEDPSYVLDKDNTETHPFLSILGFKSSQKESKK